MNRLALIRRQHRLKVDFVLRSRAMHHLRQHFAPVLVRHQVEFPERREKMQSHVAVFSRGMKIPNRQCVNHQIAKNKIADRLRGRQQSASRIARRRQYLERRSVDAVSIFHRVIDVALRVYGAGQVIVQVAALRHPIEKTHQFQRLFSH